MAMAVSQVTVLQSGGPYLLKLCFCRILEEYFGVPYQPLLLRDPLLLQDIMTDIFGGRKMRVTWEGGNTESEESEIKRKVCENMGVKMRMSQGKCI